MCALDALAVSPVYEPDTIINSSCRVSATPVNLRQHKLEIPNIDDNSDVFFILSWNIAANKCCATSLCTERGFLKRNQLAERWRTEKADKRELFQLHDAVDFVAAFLQSKKVA